MKLHLPTALLSFLLGMMTFAGSQARADYTFGTGDATNNLGNIMYVGDSITHGVNSGSYRWAMHKIFVDNGISYTPQGYNTGCHSGPVGTRSSYGGSLFVNEHSAQSSARAYEIAGTKAGGRFNGTNIKNWLGQSSVTTNGAAYTGKTWTDVNTFFLMIGTNDTLSDYAAHGIGYGKNLETATTTLLGTKAGEAWDGKGLMDIIVDSMIQSGADRGAEANIVVATLPCWMDGRGNNNNAADFAAIAQYNQDLKDWGSKKGVTVVDVNRGMLDVARTDKPGVGVASMFGGDKLHPSAQGDLIIAGNIAHAMGYAGRTAGQERKAAADFAGVRIGKGAFTEAMVQETFSRSSNVAVNAEENLQLGGGEASSFSVAWEEGATLKNGFTVDFDLKVGDGAQNGWNTADSFQMTVGNGSVYGTISISEAYISWGGTILWSEDMSVNADTLRVAYVTGNEAEGLSAGYYIWLDDMLIGEGLAAYAGSGHNGVSVSCSGTLSATLGSLAMDGSGSYAPTTSGVSFAEQGYHMTLNVFDTDAPPQGAVTYPKEYTHTVTNGVASGTYSARAAANASSGTGAVVSVTVEKGTAGFIISNIGEYTGDVYTTVKGGSATTWYAAHGVGSGNDTTANFTGNVGLCLAGEAGGSHTVFGIVNAGTVVGNVYLELSAAGATFDTFTETGAVSVVGSYQGSITGTLHMQVNSGTFSHRVAGGIHTGGNDSIGTTRVYVNGGILKEGVFGGGRAGTIGSAVSTFSSDASSEPAARVVVTGGEIAGGVWGGGFGDAASGSDNINGDTQVEVAGGVISGGVHGGGTGGTINGNTHVVITGNLPQIDSRGTISGGGTGGTITGNSTVTLRNVNRGNNPYGFDKFAGTISGGTNVNGSKTLVLDNVQVSYAGATLQDFNTVSLTGGTSTALTTIGGADRLEMAEGTMLDLTGAKDLNNLQTVVVGDDASLTVDVSQLTTPAGVVFDISQASRFTLIAAENPSLEGLDLSNITFYRNGTYYAAEATIPDTQAGTVMLQVGERIPEPSTAVLSLLALAGLAARRRRR